MKLRPIKALYGVRHNPLHTLSRVASGSGSAQPCAITLYQSCHSAVVSSLRVVAGLQQFLSFPANSKLVC